MSSTDADNPSVNQTPPQDEPPFLTRIFVTGGSGFVGRSVVRKLVACGHKPICLVRDRLAFTSRMTDLPSDRYETVCGDLFDDAALAEASSGAEAAIHLVGIITERRFNKQTFDRVHVTGTQRVIDACHAAGMKRFVHMSALGTRPNAVSRYHQTKWAAENMVRDSGLEWTLFRPSIIHGPEGEFMRMMRVLLCKSTVPLMFGLIPAPFPIIPYFGDGQNKVQPVSVQDVAQCVVAALSLPQTIGQTYEMGGPKVMTWKELHRICRELMPGAKRWKPMVSQPVIAAKIMARTVMRLPILPRMLRFNEGQVQMSQENAVCDTREVEETFGIRLRDFRTELAAYAGMIS